MDEDSTAEYAQHLLKVINKENFWDSIDSVMKWLYKFHFAEMKGYEREAKQARDNSYDKFGRAKDDNGKISNDMRQLVMVPEIFLNVINRFYGGSLDGNNNKLKFYREYAKRYPQFKKAKSI